MKIKIKCKQARSSGQGNNVRCTGKWVFRRFSPWQQFARPHKKL